MDPERFEDDAPEPTIDAHGFSSARLPCELAQSHEPPEICFGIDDVRTPPSLLRLAHDTCTALGWSFSINRPFAGALVPMFHYGREPYEHALMIKVRRDLYMDEATGERSSRFASVQQRHTGVLQQLASA